MATVQLVKHKMEYCDSIFRLASAPPVKDALGLRENSVEDTKLFIQHILDEERLGKSVSRVILYESGDVIGVTTLMFIDYQKKACHIGTWIGHEYWGQGYNDASKIAILHIAFEELDLLHVFAGARKVNIRSQKAQEKLPFIRLHVEAEFPEEHAALERKEKQPCILHAFYREDFINYLNQGAAL